MVVNCMKKLSGIESFFYNLQCVLTLGTWWMIKVLIKKAIIDAMNEKTT